MFKYAIVRIPSRSMVDGITAHPELGRPDWHKAVAQHDAYMRALERCGLAVEVLPADEAFPDSCFVEDVAVCTPAFALVSSPGAPARRAETAGMEAVLRRHYETVESLASAGPPDPACTLEGGDVMMAGKHFYVGLSSRTSPEGARRFIALLERHGYTGQAVRMPPTLHLKTGLSYLEDGCLLVDEAFAHHGEFDRFHRIHVDPLESYAANCLRINEYVLVPEGYPKTLSAIREAGFRTIELDMSEFRKLDGGLSCLSLRF